MNSSCFYFNLMNSTFSRYPSLDNYLDTLKNQDETYLSHYQFFQGGEDSLFGISPENNCHIYSNDQNLVRDFLKNHGTNFNVFFSYWNNDVLLRQLIGRELNGRPFYYLGKPPTAVSTSSLEMRLATAQDQELVNKWYEEFNKEENSSWKAPDLATDVKARLFLFFKDQQFVGGSANTLHSGERLWIGRLWVRPESRKQGVGELMMNEIENLAFKEKKQLALLVSDHNEKALNLYEKLNYQELGHNSYWY